MVVNSARLLNDAISWMMGNEFADTPAGFQPRVTVLWCLPLVKLILQFFFYIPCRKFVVYLCLLIFTALISLRLDEVIKTSYWAIFSPLWVWKLLAFVGAIVGTYAWWKKPASRMDAESYIHFKSMLLSMSLHLLLLFFEVLACDKLESKRHIWVLVFLPLFFLSIVCIAVSIWSLKHERPFEVSSSQSLEIQIWSLTSHFPP